MIDSDDVERKRLNESATTEKEYYVLIDAWLCVGGDSSKLDMRYD